MANNPIVIRKGFKLGELDAEADKDLMLACFVDKGELHKLLDVLDPASVILGRTGSGKSALLHKIVSDAEHACMLNPHDISVQFLESSNIIQFFNELGIKLDIFYRMLWRHILAVEFIKLRYDLRSEKQNHSLLQRIYEFIAPDSSKKKAFEYFSEWGDRFWIDTNEQLQEITHKFTKQVEANFTAKGAPIDISLNGVKSLDETRRTEVKSLAMEVVSGIQIKKLNDVLDFLADFAFDDPQKRYYILIDQLDEDWAESETRYRFIRALIEETKAIRRIPQVKVVSALRRDLLDIVFDRTRGAGFQEEKYESYLLPLQWSRSDLLDLVELRIQEIFRRQYTSQNVRFLDVFPSPKKTGGARVIDYVIDRTLCRPRDVLQFLNYCLMGAADRERVSWRVIYSAESTYSAKRLGSLIEEWSEVFPALNDTLEILRGIDSPFTRSALSGERLESVIFALIENKNDDPCSVVAKQYYAPGKGGSTESDVVSAILMCLYHVGAIGIKISSRDTYMWSYVDQPRVSKSEVKRANQIRVHRMIHQVLEVRDVEANEYD